MQIYRIVHLVNLEIAKASFEQRVVCEMVGITSGFPIEPIWSVHLRCYALVSSRSFGSDDLINQLHSHFPSKSSWVNSSRVHSLLIKDTSFLHILVLMEYFLFGLLQFSIF
jgi:hypothetical protein